MKLHLLLLSIALCCAPLLAEDTPTSTELTTQSGSSSTAQSDTPTTVPTTTDKPTTPTDKPTTSTDKPTTPTDKPTTPTDKPTTPTDKPTTPTDKPTTPTDKPTTPTDAPNTTVAPITSTVAPTPPTPNTNDYVLKYDNNMTCARLQLNITAKIPYNEVNGTGVYELKPGTNMTMLDSSTCNGPNGTELIHLLVEGKHHLDITLLKNKDMVSLSLSLTYSQEDMENATNPQAVYTVDSSKDLWSVPTTRSYLCNSEVAVTLTPAVNITGAHEVVATLWDVRYMGYVNQTTSDYTQEMECDQDTQMADIVPIAVGVALAALVVLVVIAYTVSRRRTKKQRGYQSV